MTGRHDHCAACGKAEHIDNLDSKPEPTVWLWAIRLFRGQAFMLSYAADRGHDFTRLECAACYGPGYEVGP